MMISAFTETQAILRYVDRILPAPPLTPSDSRRAARMDQVKWGGGIVAGSLMIADS
jgi:glutathione S-transferase